MNNSELITCTEVSTKAGVDILDVSLQLVDGEQLVRHQLVKLLLTFTAVRSLSNLGAVIRIFDQSGRCAFAKHFVDLDEGEICRQLDPGRQVWVVHFSTALPVGWYAVTFSLAENSSGDFKNSAAWLAIAEQTCYVPFYIADSVGSERGYCSLSAHSYFAPSGYLDPDIVTSRGFQRFPWFVHEPRYSVDQIIAALHDLLPDLRFQQYVVDVELVLSPGCGTVELPASHPRLYTQVGQRSDHGVASTGEAGVLLFGPYIFARPGQYVVTFLGKGNFFEAGKAYADVAARKGGLVLGNVELNCENGLMEWEIPFVVPEPGVHDLEFRVFVGQGVDFEIFKLNVVSVEQQVLLSALQAVFNFIPFSIENSGGADNQTLIAALAKEQSFEHIQPELQASEIARVAMTVSCADCSSLPKVSGAGSSFDYNGQSIQLMHDGTRVVAGGYFGKWMQMIIQRLQGHHEPQEERLFDALLKHVRPASLMIELGCYWAYYSNWFVGAVPQGRSICIEPDVIRLGVGMQNFRLNNREATFYVAAAGGQYEPERPFVRESDGQMVTIPFWDFGKLLEKIGSDNIELLHMDAQGAELPFLQSIESTNFLGRLRFIVVSTHHKLISGSATTHRDCLATLINLGAFILCEHSVDESFSGDGLIVASFAAEDVRLVMPHISRNRPEDSLFGPDPKREENTFTGLFNCMGKPLELENIPLSVECVQANDGPMNVFSVDSVIGAALKSNGSFGTEKIDEVLNFLKDRYDFSPQLFVDVGANIGTHLIHALKNAEFELGIAVEPDPYNYALLVQNVVANELQDRVQVFRVALSSRSGVAAFELCSENFGDHRVRVPDIQTVTDLGEGQRRLISVLKDTGDELFCEYGLTLNNQTLMWIDTQGHEGYVFQGFSHLLTLEKKPFIVCEFWPYGLERANAKEAFFEFLNKCSVIYDINCVGWMKSPVVELTELEKLYSRMLEDTRLGHYPHTDLLCVLR
jgi:FkbM family methyltransferase